MASQQPKLDELKLSEQQNEFERQYLAEIESDIDEETESLTEELEALHNRKNNLKSTLLSKLKLYPDGDFPVSEYSKYNEDEWKLADETYEAEKKSIFFKAEKDRNLFNKQISYHFLPTFHPQGTVKSFQTTISYSNLLNLLNTYVFVPNQITEFPKDLSSISIRMLNNALDEARDSEHSTHYKNLYQIIGFWALLSENALIQEEYRLDINTNKVINKKRQKDVIKVSAKKISPHEPFTQEELECLINYAVFWTEKAIPVIEEAISYSKEIGIHKTKRKFTNRRHREKKLEELFSKKVNNVEIIGYTTTIKVDKRDNESSISYYINQKLREAIDKVRNAVFIFVALLTGLRRRELANLKFNDFYKSLNGECFVDITRFKIAEDPNYTGESETLPIPNYLYDYIVRLKDLREYIGNIKDGHLFISSKSRKTRIEINSSIIILVINQLSNVLNFDNLKTHRFRKTIAEVLIYQDETNLEIVRLLLGHKSYTMTLRYVARNPHLVRAISRIMEFHHVKEFTEVIEEISSGHYSGHPFERMAKQIGKRPEAFKGAALKLTINEYVLTLLQAGEPIFIHRIPVGGFCVSVPMIAGEDLTPCVKDAELVAGMITPDTSNCQYTECTKAGLTLKAKTAIEENIIFFTGLLEQEEVEIPRKARQMLIKRIKREKLHLKNLLKYRDPFANVEEVKQEGASK